MAKTVCVEAYIDSTARLKYPVELVKTFLQIRKHYYAVAKNRVEIFVLERE
tara:strand:+ start:324 stop:476 length:153 start_codon:yes stop_codon:yes gene_type:complete